jgi:ParB-like chromosome segregation protein Spo0J
MDPANAAEESPEQPEQLTDEQTTDEPAGPSGADQFIRDPRTEKVLADNHLEYEFLVIDIPGVDLSALDRGNPEVQMRDEIIHADVAQRYAEDLKWGAQFPAGVLSKHAGKYRIVDFHHRMWAARAAGLTQVSAYVVGELADFDLVEAGNLLNRNHGVPLTEGERIRQALWGLELQRFKTVKQAARVLGIPESKVSKEKRIREAKALAAEAGVSMIAFENLPRATKDRLASIDSPQVFKAAADSIIGKGLDTVEAGKLVTQINDAGGDAAKLDVIKAFASDIEPKKATVSNLADPWFRIHTACRAILAVDLGAEFDLSLGRRSAHDLSMLFTEAKDVTDKLALITAKLDAIEHPGDAEPQANAG